MASLSLKSISQMLSSAAAAAQAACSQLLDLSIGSPARALLYATSMLWSWNQSNINLVLRASRLSTCSGSDVDSFVGDYGLSRAAAVYATGQVTLSRNVSTGSATVLVGSQVRTGDGSITYSITADATNAYWSGSAGTSGGYVIPPGISSITVPIQCTTIGAAGNVIAGAISLFGTAISGIDIVSNALAIENGADAQSDASLKLAFVAFLASLSKATPTAIVDAVNAVQADITCILVENQDSAGNPARGWFVIYTDDGSGNPPSALLTSIRAAVEATRPVSVQYAVMPPVVSVLSINLTIVVSSGSAASLYAGVQQAVSAYVDSLPVGGTCSIFGIQQAAAGSSSLIINVKNVAINGLTTDQTPAQKQIVYKAGQVTVSS